MALTAGDKLGPYEIISLIGKGGMGEVYSAHDSRTGRDVAIKISAERFSERFDREVRAVAALNHPNICTLFDVGPDYLVMELVEGESPRGPLPLEEALRIARQIASALEAAHEKGVTHRDLKPGNIKIKPDGTVKVLDFGLAKMGGTTAASGASSPEVSPTLSMATHEGMILGTAAYMAPEQAKGKLVDKRADIWAFGVVVHELLTGQRLFQQDDVTETLAAVVLKPPDLESAPVEVRRLLKKCLEKDPRKRLRDIGDVWELLELAPVRAAEAPPARARPSWLPWAFSGVLLLALAAALAWIFKPSPAPIVTRFAIPPGEGEQYSNTGRQFLTISPDGMHVAYVTNRQLYLRAMQESEARALPGTESTLGVVLPLFSPDGKSIVFYTLLERALKRVAIGGGAPVTLRQGIFPYSMTWGSDGILFTQPNAGIVRISPDGGKLETVVKPRDNEQLDGPEMLPGGQAILYSVAAGESLSGSWDRANVVVEILKSGVRKTLVENASGARYLPTGHLVYAVNGVLFAQPFDVRRLETTGGAVPVVEGVARTLYGGAQFDFSNTGALAYLPGPVSGLNAGHAILALVDRNGNAEPIKAVPPGAYGFPRVSRDGRRIAYQAADNQESGIWIYQLSAAAAPRRLTLPGTGANRFPIWSPDAKRVAFQSDREGDLGIFWQLADGSGAAERITKPGKGVADIPDSWSPDGQTISFTEKKSDGDAIWMYSLRDKKATVFAATPGLLLGGSVFSPDGHWVAYQESNPPASRREISSIIGRVYVQPFPPGAARYQAPQDADTHHPLWSPDGMELFYSAGPSLFGSMSITTKPSVNFGSPVRAPRAGFTTAAPGTARPYDILPDGKHFIGLIPATLAQSGGKAAQIQVVLNWFEEVKQRSLGQ
jgi:Tol biopolymer transport system component